MRQLSDEENDSALFTCNMLSLLYMLYILMIWKLQAMFTSQFNMYNINNHRDGYCLMSHYTSAKDGDYNGVFVLKYDTPSYCLRQPEGIHFLIDSDFKNTIDRRFTFSELKEQNITSEMLLSWSASLDLTEHYQIFLNNDSSLSLAIEDLFYNCTPPWFGPFCRFAFDYTIAISFDYIIPFIFEFKLRINKDAKVTCYDHLHCQTLLPCLDWREICDGKHDCLDGTDEENCWQLEVNECASNEFRCHNGQCIPIEFFHDEIANSDCMDRTDEYRDKYDDEQCSKVPFFRCEEHVCLPGTAEFPCGDGQCTNGIRKCYNGRSSRFPRDFCSNATACSMQLTDQVDPKWCKKFCPKTNCIKDNCPMLYEFLSIPRLFGHIRFLYLNNESEPDQFILPNYICYDEKHCAEFLPPTVHFGNLTCRHFHELGLKNTDSYDNVERVVQNVKNRFHACLIVNNEMHYCNYSTMYQCKNSIKCISKQRLLDSISDCPFNDDETFHESCSLLDIRQRFTCSSDGDKKCFSALIFQDGKYDCTDGEDEFDSKLLLTTTHISFQTICDNKTELEPVLIDGRNETDETECDYWPCNNTYSRCDGFWSCRNGADEIDCLPSTCPKLHHICVLMNETSKVSCLPIKRAGDGVDDCLGATDERTNYYREHFMGFTIQHSYRFHCWNDTQSIPVSNLCNKKPDCRFNDDEVFCKNFRSIDRPLCFNERSATDVEQFFCRFDSAIPRQRVIHFKLSNEPMYLLKLTTNNMSVTPSIRTNLSLIARNRSSYISSNEAWWCNRGIPVRIRMNSNISKTYCLCPPSYYGSNCQYQNQRVSLTLQIRVTLDWHITSVFLITLIDNERNIHSHAQVEYLPSQDCRNKFNIYLLYSTRPKNSTKNYSVQIDVFNQSTFKYRASWIFPVRFPFLPVYRLAVLLKVPLSDMESIQGCRSLCIHGQCFDYVNDQKSMFCRCEPGWSGIHCDVEYRCDCAPNSLCISNSSCLCPPGRFGRRCYLSKASCHSKSCLNGGQCVPIDARVTYGYSRSSACICPDGYIGDRCEHRQRQTRIDISFHNQIVIPSLLLIHFIDVHENAAHNRTSIMKKIGFDQYSLTVVTTVLFNIAIAQISTDYYLIILYKDTIVSSHILTQVIPSNRCLPIHVLFNKTFANQHLLKRIKYYHLPCQQQSELTCFYDDIHFCLCTFDRQANCFEFDHNTTYDCGEYNVCENRGHCFQDNVKCPTSLICVCLRCYFGTKCQFSTKGSILSLDIILGYHVHPNIGISQQPIIVKVAIVLTTVMFIAGSINSFLSFQTFRRKGTRNVGCGFYLFTSSIISMIIVITFVMKIVLFLLSQTGVLNNGAFAYIQCVSLDFLFRFLLSTSDWLNACVAIERAVNVLHGLKFNKSKSKQVAKWMILIVLLFTSCSYMYDPLHRHLLEDEAEQRTWCVNQYSPSLQIFDWFLNVLHFSIPFTINCISALTVIVSSARTRSNCQQKKSFKQHILEQIQYHKHLLISACILVILAVPRLIISFLSGCMESARDSWFYLIGYFISFTPSMMTFVVFVLPSEIYKKEFRRSMKRICQQ